jgi:hypothetical protein
MMVLERYTLFGQAVDYIRGWEYWGGMGYLGHPPDQYMKITQAVVLTLGEIGDKRAVFLLDELNGDEFTGPRHQWLFEVSEAVAAIRLREAVPMLIERLQHSDRGARAEAALQLLKISQQIMPFLGSTNAARKLDEVMTHPLLIRR